MRWKYTVYRKYVIIKYYLIIKNLGGSAMCVLCFLNKSKRRAFQIVKIIYKIIYK